MNLYDTIGDGYATTRRADARIVQALRDALGLAPGATIADIGAGTGNYSRALADAGAFTVYAIEPSPVMRAQAPSHPRVHYLDAGAAPIPLPDRAVDGVVSTLAIHHFPDLAGAFREMARITTPAAPMVLYTFDVGDAESGPAGERFWLEDYFPSFYTDTQRTFPPLAAVAATLAATTGRTVTTIPFPLPHDLTDLCLAAGWRRPDLYLEPQVRAGISSFALGDPDAIASGLERLRQDRESGVWEQRYGHLRTRDSFDAGYRLLCARAASV